MGICPNQHCSHPASVHEVTFTIATPPELVGVMCTNCQSWCVLQKQGTTIAGTNLEIQSGLCICGLVTTDPLPCPIHPEKVA